MLLQQNLRCKVWDDTAKITYICNIYPYVHRLPSMHQKDLSDLKESQQFTAVHQHLSTTEPLRVIAHAPRTSGGGRTQPAHATWDSCGQRAERSETSGRGAERPNGANRRSTRTTGPGLEQAKHAATPLSTCDTYPGRGRGEGEQFDNILFAI